MLIGAQSVHRNSEIRAIDPATGQFLDPVFGGGTSADVDRACSMAARDFDAFRSADLNSRALLLESIAQGIHDLGDELIERAMSESALARPRLEGERMRTSGQLRLFATLVR